MMSKPITLAQRKGLNASQTSISPNISMPDVPYPINSYGTLKQAVMLWADRDDQEFINQIPNFIDFAQKNMYRQLDIQPMHKESYLPISEGKADLPSDFLQGDYLYFALNGVFFRETTQAEISAKLNSVESRIKADDVNIDYMMENDIEPIFCRVGKRLWFYPAITANAPVQENGYTGPIPQNAVVYGYYADPQRMTNDSEDPYLLDVAPDFFLYTTLKQAAYFTGDYDAVEKFDREATRILDAIKEMQKRLDFRTSPLLVNTGNIHNYWG